MRKLLPITVTSLLLTACGGSLTVEQQSFIAEQKAKDMQQAQANFTTVKSGLCSLVYKNKMHDPDSLEWVSEWEFNDLLSNTVWRSDILRKESKFIPNRRVVFSRTLRGKNAFGGKVLGTAYCHFEVTDTDIKLFNASNGQFGYK